MVRKEAYYDGDHERAGDPVGSAFRDVRRVCRYRQAGRLAVLATENRVLPGKGNAGDGWMLVIRSGKGLSARPPGPRFLRNGNVQKNTIKSAKVTLENRFSHRKNASKGPLDV